MICPSRELARQTFEVVEEFVGVLRERGYPDLRPMLCIGGIDMKSQLEIVKKGVHIVIATPGRLKDMLAKKKMNLDNCSVAKIAGSELFNNRRVNLWLRNWLKESPENWIFSKKSSLPNCGLQSGISVIVKVNSTLIFQFLLANFCEFIHFCPRFLLILLKI